MDSNEHRIVDALIAHLRSTEEATSVFIREKVVEHYSRRADLVVANGVLSAYEIKSAADSLGRLDGQLDAYKRSFERVSIVCARNHLRSVRQVVDKSRVGIYTITPDGQIELIRRPRCARIAKGAWLDHLTATQIARLLRSCGVPVSRSDMGRQNLVQTAAKLPHSQIRIYALQALKTHNSRMSDMRARKQLAAEERKLLFASDPYYSV